MQTQVQYADNINKDTDIIRRVNYLCLMTCASS